MPRWVHSISFCLVTAFLGVAVLISPVGIYIEREFGLGWLFTLRGPVAPPPQVAVVGINSSSGPDLGISRLPRNWPRSLHGVLVKRIMASGAEGIVFDMDFSQPKVPIEDLTFADAVRESGQVVLFERLEGRNERIVSGNNASRWVWVETAQPPADPLAQAARAVAPFPLPKIDKSSFQFWAFKPSADDAPTTASMAVQMALLPYHQTWREILDRAGVASFAVPPATALQRPGALREHMQQMRKLFLGQPYLADRLRELIESASLDPAPRRAVEVLAALYGGPDDRYTNLYGPPGMIPTISYQDMVAIEDIGAGAAHGEIEATEISRHLQGRTVFVGYSDLFSPDQPDRFHTIFTDKRGIDLSGCEIMATAFANLLTDRTVKPLNPLLGLVLVALFGLVISHLVYWPSAYIAVPFALVIAAGYVLGAGEIFAREDLWLPLATPIAVQLPFAIVAGLLGQYLTERRHKLRVGAELANYLPEHLVKDLTSGRVDAASLNQVVHGVCLATDMSGFSTISESKSPSELAKFMNDYFEALAQALKRCEVGVTEFHADTIMCAWIGEPDDPEVRRNAVRAALEVVRAIEDFSASDPTVSLTARVGLQDGPFYLGHTGGGGRFTYSILGDPANSAARLEGLNKRLGTRILAAASVTEGLDNFALRPLGEFKVVGKANVVPVVEVVAPTGDVAAETVALHQGFASAMEVFLSERWEAAATLFAELTLAFPSDRASAFYLDICQRYAAGGAPGSEPTRLAMTEK
jgi:adenylate cyclase